MNANVLTKIIMYPESLNAIASNIYIYIYPFKNPLEVYVQKNMNFNF